MRIYIEKNKFVKMKIIAFVFGLTALFELVCLSYNIARSVALEELLADYQYNRENSEKLIGMQKVYLVRQEELCLMHRRFGEAYRILLKNIIDRLGLNRRLNSATLLVREFDDLVRNEKLLDRGG